MITWSFWVLYERGPSIIRLDDGLNAGSVIVTVWGTHGCSAAHPTLSRGRGSAVQGWGARVSDLVMHGQHPEVWTNG